MEGSSSPKNQVKIISKNDHHDLRANLNINNQKKKKNAFNKHMALIRKRYNSSIMKLLRLKKNQRRRNSSEKKTKKIGLNKTATPINKSQEFSK